MGNYLLISDAAKEVKVESHVLRYWEEELHLPIKRNELGHRYYTKEDVERFKQIKSMKERGLQLKAIKMILRDGRLDVLPQEDEEDNQSLVKEEQDTRERDERERDTREHDTREQDTREQDAGEGKVRAQEGRGYERAEQDRVMAIDIVSCRSRENETMLSTESREEKAKRLQWLLQQLIRETLRENNQELSREIKESIVKELDYQFRSQEEREEEREVRREQRDEAYYRRMDELLRKKSKAPFFVISGKKSTGRRDTGEGKKAGEREQQDCDGRKTKKKRHSHF